MEKNKLIKFSCYFISVLAITSLLISCGKDIKTEVKNDKKEKTDTSKKNSSTAGNNSPGKEIFYMKSKENNIACADCHSDGTNSSNILTKYFSNIQGANKRTSTYHGKFTGEEVAKNAGGATVCWETYMKIKTPMSEEQIKYLNEYYSSLAGSDTPKEMNYETIALPTRDKAKLKDVQKVIMSMKGDPIKGEQEFKNSCGFCHSDNSAIKKVPPILEDFEGNIKSIIYNVRLGNGAMPFFKTQSMSDQEVADISAYIMQKNTK